MLIGVTGGAGYIGSTLIRRLLNEGHEITSIDNQSIGSYELIKEHFSGEKIKSVVGDIRDQETLSRIFKEVDAIAHLAALPGLTKCNESPEEAILTNIYGTHQIMENARRLDVNRVIFSSTAAVYGTPENIPVKEIHPLNPLNLYGVTKLAGEKILNYYNENYGIETVILRFGNVYGLGLFTRFDTVIPKFVKQAIDGHPLTIYGDGGQSRDFVHVEDISKAIEHSITKPQSSGQVFNVGGETITINNLSQTVKELVESISKITVKITSMPQRRGETKEFSYDLTKIKKKMRFRNDWVITEGVKQLIKYYKK